MKLPHRFFLLIPCLLPLAAQEPAPPVPPSERVYVGMVADDGEGGGLLVRAVAPGSPAHKAGVCAGDVLLRAGGVSLNSRQQLRQLVAASVQGTVLPVELSRAGRQLTLRITLELRLDSEPRRTAADAALGADRHVQPIQLPDSIRQEIRRHRRVIREQLASLPDGLEPATVTRELQAIRDLARDAHAARPGWMSGRAGEISVRFRDEEGSVVLYGANNLLSLELYTLDGQLISRYELNTPAERGALPLPVLQRLQRFR